ncbi:MAG TPA: HAMP domain-containing sensor histidine kinase [Candidatus Thermoplasmatota archaeon]|nr:HAMP domain-containing sensor histidine kinase [Candidatus Thermoplasmatota archaeon]
MERAPGWPAVRPAAIGVGVTLLAALVAHALAVLAGRDNTLQRVSVVLVFGVVILVAARWGIRASLPSALVGGAYALYFFAVFSSRDALSQRLVLGGAIAATTLVLATVVGALRTRADRAAVRALEAERERARTAERANAQLQRTNEALESFTYVVSHDLKEPVRALDAYLEMAQEKATVPEVRDAIARAKDANTRLARLLNGLLEMSRAARHGPAEAHPVWPGEVVDSPTCRSRYQDVLAARGGRLEVTCLQGTPPVLATEEGLAQALGNLIVNAIKHNPRASPLVRVRIQPLDAEGAEVDVTVEDDGPGFSPETLARFRERRGVVSLRDAGFGLVIVQRAVESVGGRVWIGRSDLGGAAVHVILQAASAEALREDRPRAASPRPAEAPRPAREDAP